jgi:hypothetical protein
MHCVSTTYLENSVFEIIFIVNHVLKVPLVPKVPIYNENRILKGEEYKIL